MALTDDGSTLYVALESSATIAAVDTSTLAVQTYPLGAGNCPVSLAVTQDVVWFAHTCDSFSGAIGALDPATGAIQEEVAGGDLYFDPILAASPALPGTVLASSRQGNPAPLTAYDASTSPEPTLTRRAQREDIGAQVQDLAITPDGSRVIAAEESRHRVFLTSDLTPDGRFNSGPHPVAAAVRPDGTVAAGVSQFTDNIYLYKPDSRMPYRTYDLGGSWERGLLPGGLAFGTERLYTVSGYLSAGKSYRLHMIVPRDPSSVGIDIGRRESVKYGTKVTAALTLDTASPNRHVVLYGTVPGTNQRDKIAARDIGSEGATVTFTARKNWRLDAVYGGDETTDADTASATILVEATAEAKVLNAVRQSYGTAYLHSGDTAMVLAKVKASAPCARFRIEVEKMGRFHKLNDTRCLALGSTGRIKLGLRSRPGTGYYTLRVAAFVPEGRYNTFGSSQWREIQFCVGALPCSPGGRAVAAP
jgi:DNA-binding beta-propeller fold protein YncE